VFPTRADVTHLQRGDGTDLEESDIVRLVGGRSNQQGAILA